MLLSAILGRCAMANGEFADQGLIFNETAGVFNCQITVDSAPHEFQAYDATNKEGYFYLDFHGLESVSPLDLNFKSRYIRHVKRLYYPQQKVVRFVFYTLAAARIELERQSELSYQVRLTPGQGQPNLMRLRNDSNKRLIVIDPGHGGDQSGALSRIRINGRRLEEKDLTLQISKKLHELCASSPNMIATMTRTGDETLSLKQRVDRAQSQDGDLFVSIHLNASSNSEARGFEVYYISERGQAQEAHDTLLKLENDLIEKNEDSTTRELLQDILNDYTNENIKAMQVESQRLAESVDKYFREQGPFRRNHRGVKLGAFQVLKNVEMPAILVECGFLTNEHDAKAMVDEAVQWQIARLIYNGINHYLSKTDPTFSPHWAQ